MTSLSVRRRRSGFGAVHRGDERLEAADSAARELLSRGSTRVLLEKRSAGNTAALDEAKAAEQEQIGVLESILSME